MTGCFDEAARIWKASWCALLAHLRELGCLQPSRESAVTGRRRSGGLRKRPTPQVIERLQGVPREELLTSVVCVMDLRFGTARVPSGERLWKRIAEEVLPRIRALPFGEAEGILSGDVLANLESRGETIGVEDVLIGTTALANGLTIVTRNVRHFRRIQGLKVESWWPAEPPAES